MSRTFRILTLTFLESFATILYEKAAYFYCHQRLGFSNAANLALALVFGLLYVAGAMSSHRVSRRLGERRALLLTVVVQLATFAAVGTWPVTGVLFGGAVVMGMLFGLKWPVIESYVSAGHTPAAAAGAVGRFSLSWASAVPISLAVAGPLIDWQPWAIFYLGVALSVLSVGLIASLPARPAHLPHDHPDRPDSARLRRLALLTRAARWQMLANYSSMWMLAALLPDIFDRLGFGVETSAALSGVLDVARVAAFAVLGFWTAWHGRRSGLVRSMAFLAAGFVLVLSGGNVLVVVAGELLFGWAVGEVYYAALYYAMVVQNASVEAGGGHEGLIGLGFALGPAAGLVGVAAEPLLGGELAGVLLVGGMLVLLCFTQAARALAAVGKV